MRILIDGHNALFAMGIQGRTHEQQRHALLRLVGAVAPGATVFFDARNAPSDSREPASELGVKVVYCRRREADAAILEAIRDADDPERILLVSNDRGLTGPAVQLGARRKGVQEFFGARTRQEEEEGEEEGSGVDERGAPRILRGRWRFKPSDFGLPEFVDLDNPDLDD